MQSSIDICIATYRRPVLLAKLLASLAGQSVRRDASLRVIVVDNDAARSAESIVRGFKEQACLEIVYDVEPCQGISYARNRALTHVSSQLLAFIDDDEEADARWLEEMVETMTRSGVDVVFGPVIAMLPASAPAWAQSQPCFQRPRLPTGTLVESGAMGNVLMRSKAISGRVEPFDIAFARTGGEDTRLFKQLHEAGVRMAWCDEAQVYESVPPERLTLSWVLARAFRGGQTYYRIFLAEQPLIARLTWLAKRLVGVSGGMVVLPLIALQGAGAGVRWLARIVGWLGQLSQIFGRCLEYKEYRGA